METQAAAPRIARPVDDERSRRPWSTGGGQHDHRVDLTARLPLRVHEALRPDIAPRAAVDRREDDRLVDGTAAEHPPNRDERCGVGGAAGRVGNRQRVAVCEDHQLVLGEAGAPADHVVERHPGVGEAVVRRAVSEPAQRRGHTIGGALVSGPARPAVRSILQDGVHRRGGERPVEQDVSRKPLRGSRRRALERERGDHDGEQRREKRGAIDARLDQVRGPNFAPTYNLDC